VLSACRHPDFSAAYVKQARLVESLAYHIWQQRLWQQLLRSASCSALLDAALLREYRLSIQALASIDVCANSIMCGRMRRADASPVHNEEAASILTCCPGSQRVLHLLQYNIQTAGRYSRSAWHRAMSLPRHTQRVAECLALPDHKCAQRHGVAHRASTTLASPLCEAHTYSDQYAHPLNTDC
jgi:hypothetical protein